MGLFDFLKPKKEVKRNRIELKRNEIKRINLKSSHSFKGFKQLFVKARYDLYQEGQEQLLKRYASVPKGQTLSGLPVAFILNDNGKDNPFIELVVDNLFQGIIWKDSLFFNDILNGKVEKVTVLPEDGELRFFIKLK